MLLIAYSLGQLRFGELMKIYVEGNLENGAAEAPDETEDRQIQIGEEMFYQYLHDVFFTTPENRYAVWAEDGKYISALRLEPYQDGLLLEALETVPEKRRKGYAAKLISAVQQELAKQGNITIYSHVSKTNAASLRTHEKCGFRRIKDYAAYIDGSVNNRAYTLVFEVSKNKTQNCEIGD